MSRYEGHIALIYYTHSRKKGCSVNIEVATDDLKISYLVETNKQKRELINLLNKKDVKIEFYSNFIIVNGKTFNGWNKENLMKLIPPEEKEIEMDLDYEDS